MMVLPGATAPPADRDYHLLFTSHTIHTTTTSSSLPTPTTSIPSTPTTSGNPTTSGTPTTSSTPTTSTIFAPAKKPNGTLSKSLPSSSGKSHSLFSRTITPPPQTSPQT